MSDNEDLLTYEIGDVHDDGDDLDAVEDELLMSDDEHTLEDDIVPLNTKPLRKDVSARASNNDKQTTSPSVDTECSKSTAEKGPKKRTLKRNVSTVVKSPIPSKQVKQLTAQAVTEEHSSPIARNESQPNDGPAKELVLEPEIVPHTTPIRPVAQPVTSPKSNKTACSMSELESPVASLVFSQSGDNASQDESSSCVEESEAESAPLTQQSQDSMSVQTSQDESAVTDDFDKGDTELEDSDDCTERMNARLCVERDIGQEPPMNSQLRPPFYKNQRGGMSPRSNVGPRNFPPQFNSFGPRPNNQQFHPRYGPPPMMAPPQNPQVGQRMEFRGQQPLNFRPPYQNNIQRPGSRTHFTQHGHAVNRPNFSPNGPNGPQFPPYNQPNPQLMGHFEPNGPMYPSRPPFRCPTSPFVGPPRHEAAAQPPHTAPTAGPPSIVPRKVLINPNFKGGVQAATNQLMMDTIGNPQFMSAQSDAELLRQQEAFINKNRMHIEKRRYERSPDRDRERDRSYSPPRRERRYSREREIRKPMYSRGGQRGQRAGSREPPGRPFTRRRRSASLERDKLNKLEDKPTEPEDEETKKYRLEIEKQKSMREKILRDKEMRRRQAAEDKTKDEEKKPTEELTTKLTPIIVTEKKIISLKKKTDSNSSSASGGQRTVPVAKQQPDAASKKIDASSTTAPTKSKPVLRMPAVPNQRLSDLEDYDEDELLADSPTPPPSANATAGGMFTNRRVVLTTSSSKTADAVKPKVLHTKNASAKGIFDRLDAKIGVSEASKRKIQKIVIKSNE